MSPSRSNIDGYRENSWIVPSGGIFPKKEEKEAVVGFTQSHKGSGEQIKMRGFYQRHIDRGWKRVRYTLCVPLDSLIRLGSTDG